MECPALTWEGNGSSTPTTFTKRSIILKKKKKIKELLLGKMLGREYNKLYVPIIHEFLFPIIITVK